MIPPPYAAGGTCPVCHEGQVVDATDVTPMIRVKGILTCPLCGSIFSRMPRRRRK